MTKKEKYDEVEDLAHLVRVQASRITNLEEKARSGEVVAVLCLDLWPPRDWLRASVKPWEPGRYFQLCVGPIRLDVFDG